MQIQIELLGELRDLGPPIDSLEVCEGTSIKQLLDRLNLPAQQVHCVTLNGHFVRDHTHCLADGDQVSLLPPVVGG